MRFLNARPSPAIVLAVLALVFAMVGSAVAGTDGLSSKITKSKVKKISKKQANKQINNKAPGLAVDSANTAGLAADSNALGGRALGDVLPTAGAGQNAAVVNIGGGTDVVTAQITTTGTSRVLVDAVAELEGAAADERAQCVIRLDGNQISLGFETTFDDIGSNNEATLTAMASQNNVAAGAHTVTLRCTALSGTVVKDDAAINVTGIPVQ